MGKVLKIALVVGAVALAFVPGAQGILAGVLSGVGVGGGVTAGGFLAASIISGIVVPLGLTSALGIAAKALGLGPKQPSLSAATVVRLRASVDPATPRKLAFGRTALNTDIRYAEYVGTNQEYHWQVIALASHKVAAIEELWLDDKMAWSVSGGVTTDFTGYLDVYAVEEGASTNVTNISTTWNAGAQRYLTGIAHLDLRFKRTGNDKQTESPFAASITNRMTVRGKGMLVYDPRRDSTVPGGSGTHRPNDQTTWAWNVSANEIGRNPALVTLAFLLGWRINGKLAVGRGVPVERLDLASFITAANLCDEPVTLAAGGTEPRYRFDGVFSEADDGGTVLETLKTSMHALLRDAGGRISLDVLHNDLTTPSFVLTDEDFIGGFEWEQTASLTENRNIVRGRYVDPSDAALYQLVDFPQVAVASVDDIDRVASLDLPGVQSPSQAQRLAKQYLQRLKYQGTFHGEVNLKGWGMQIGRAGKVSLSTLGFADKWFRVVERGIDPTTGRVPVVLQEEAEAIYAWDHEEAAPITAAPPVIYDWHNTPLLLSNIEDDADVTLLITGPDVASPPIARATDGTAKAGELPRDFNFKLTAGTTDVTTSASWSAAIKTGSGTATFTPTAGSPNATGTVNVTACSDGAVLVVSASYGGKVRTTELALVSKQDQVPTTGGGGSGSSGTASDNTIAQTTSTIYGSANTDVLRVTAGSGGLVDLTFPGSFRRTTNGTNDAAGKWQWRTIGGTFADVASEIASTVTADKDSASSEPYNTAGQIAVTMAQTGLTAGTDYEFQLLLRNDAAGTCNWSGTASAVAS